VPLDEALAGMASRVLSEDLELVATSTGIARQLGGNLAEMFDAIGATSASASGWRGRSPPSPAKASSRA